MPICSSIETPIANEVTQFSAAFRAKGVCRSRVKTGTRMDCHALCGMGPGSRRATAVADVISV
jgi:hypothetical protein